ncbi:hypothetical protein SteCoe_32868 [Stentor coeruleus]|uniref:Uncharacterized protein n=1 Tax=Stentor coeruleus TaxID=5963 RepID=A0A1R2AY48_9CILI|nr:hypothetical protein SteCoe_32868 [Stentor coeruleus]
MLRRWFKFLATSSKSKYHARARFVFPQLSIDQAFENINNPDLFTVERSNEIINSYFTISKEYKYEIPQESKLLLLKSFEKISPIIKSLKIQDFSHMVFFLNSSKIRSATLWEELEKVCIDKHIHNLNQRQLFECARGFGSNKNKNLKLWQKLEECIMEKVYSKGHFYTYPEIRMLLNSFLITNSGTELLYEKLLQNALDEIDNAENRDLAKLSLSFMKMNNIKPEIIEVFVQHCMTKLDDFNITYLIYILKTFIKLKADGKYTSKINSMILENIHTITIKNVFDLVKEYKNVYGNDQNSYFAFFSEKIIEKFPIIWGRSKSHFSDIVVHEYSIKILAVMIENGVQPKSALIDSLLKGIKNDRLPIFYSRFKKEIDIIKKYQLIEN